MAKGRPADHSGYWRRVGDRFGAYAWRPPARAVTVTLPREWGQLLGLGVAFACAGYFPILILYEPNLDSIHSRVNIWAIPGVALCIVAVAA